MAPNRVVVAASLVMLGSVAACGGGIALRATPDTSARAASAATNPPSATAPPASAAPPTLPPTGTSKPTPTDSLTETIDYANFSDSTAIDNAWFPMTPGTQLVLQGSVNADDGRVSRKVVFTVTDLTKVIDGVRSVVVYEQDYTAGDLEEAELSFYAQDDAGAVWLMGEYPEEYDGGRFDKAPTWISGLEDAQAGIMMKAAPTIGGPSYAEGWGPAVGWTDRGRVFETNSKTCVPAGCYDGILVIDEFNWDEPDAHQLKYYAPGVGTVRVGWAGAREEEQETLQLTSLVRLSAGLRARIRNDALALDQHGYHVSKGVYAKTPPIEPPRI